MDKPIRPGPLARFGAPARVVLGVFALAVALTASYLAFGHALLTWLYEGPLWAVLGRNYMSGEPYPLSATGILATADRAVARAWISAAMLAGVAAMAWVILARIPDPARWIRLGIRSALYAVVALVVLSAFLARWGLRDEHPRYGFERVLTFTADRPWAYRPLSPAIVGAATRVWMAATGDPAPARPGGSELERAEWSGFVARARKVAILYMFVCIVALQFAMGALARAVFPGYPRALGDLLPAAVLLFSPLVFRHGGYLYDFAEWLIVALAVTAIVRDHWARFYALLVLGVLNKESNLLLVGYLALMRWDSLPRPRLWRHLAVASTIALATWVAVRIWASGNAGSPAEWWLLKNLRFWTDPGSYLLRTQFYGFGVPNLTHVASLLALTVLCAYHWADKPAAVRRAFVVMVPLNLALVLAAAYTDEMRNMSIAFPAIHLCILHTVQALYPDPAVPGARPERPVA